jgi:two-component system response regulator YesN
VLGGGETTQRTLYVSKNHLNVLFRQMTTFTFYQLLIRYRLIKAATMIISKNFSLLEVALQNGFGSLNAFERNFRGLIGVTPKEFKSNNASWGVNRDIR